MSQKSSKNLRTWSKHMSGESICIQLTQNTITNRLIIPALAVAYPNPVKGE